MLVNITADDSLRLGETREAMNAIRAYASPDANIIFGTVNDPTMGDSLRVTVLATGLCGKAEKAAPVAEKPKKAPAKPKAEGEAKPKKAAAKPKAESESAPAAE